MARARSLRRQWLHLTSTLVRPTTYEATLRACNSGGCDDSDPVTISVAPPPTTGPVPAFTADPRSGEAPVTVVFTDASTSALPITSWTWEFDDL